MMIWITAGSLSAQRRESPVAKDTLARIIRRLRPLDEPVCLPVEDQEFGPVMPVWPGEKLILGVDNELHLAVVFLAGVVPGLPRPMITCLMECHRQDGEI